MAIRLRHSLSRHCLHVHKFVLFYHSVYFRTYLEPLINGQRAYTADECSEHPEITHCIRLPDSCGKVEADTDDFRLFLCHLYFAQHYNCIPSQVAASIELTAEPPPTVILGYEYYGKNHLDRLRKRSSSVFDAPESPATYDSVMSLCHYFDCKIVSCRAEHTCLLVVQAHSDANDHKLT